MYGGAEGDRTPDPLNAIQVAQLLTFILIELAETLVAYCVNKSLSMSISLTQI